MRKPVQDIVSENVRRLMQHHPDLNTEKKLRERLKMGGGGVSALVRGTNACTLRTLERAAEVFGLQPYQLLIPDLDPANPPVVHVSETERRFYRRLQDDLQRVQQHVSEHMAKYNLEPDP